MRDERNKYKPHDQNGRLIRDSNFQVPVTIPLPTHTLRLPHSLYSFTIMSSPQFIMHGDNYTCFYVFLEINLISYNKI